MLRKNSHITCPRHTTQYAWTSQVTHVRTHSPENTATCAADAHTRNAAVTNTHLTTCWKYPTEPPHARHTELAPQTWGHTHKGVLNTV